jgi:hypothetical protein
MAPHFRLVAAAAALAASALAQVPTWPQTWQMNRSTIMMTCNCEYRRDERRSAHPPAPT